MEILLKQFRVFLLFKILGGSGGVIWESESINISGASGTVTFQLSASNNAGGFETSVYYNVSYSVDGGAFTLIQDWNSLGDMTHTILGEKGGVDWNNLEVITAGGISGSSLKIQVQALNSAAAEVFYLDDISVFEGTPDPSILVIGGLTDLDYKLGNGPSAEQSFTVSGSDLTNDIVLVQPTNFEISETSGSGFVDTSITLDGSFGTIANTTIYAQLKSGLAVSGYSGNVDVTSTEAIAKSVSLSGNVITDLPIYEDFNYGGSAGDLTATSGGNWANHSGSGAVLYATTSLSMASYPSSGVGGSSTIVGTSGEDVNRKFVEQTTGTVYFSALVNISAVTTGNYFFHLKDDGTFNFRAKVGAMDDGGGKILFGIRASSSTLTYGTTPFDLNTTYLIVASYNIGSGVSNLYVLTTPESTEPVTPEATDTGTSETAISAVALRQSSDIPTTTIDGVQEATSWNDIATIPLSTDDFSTNNFKIYPNPTALGYVNISSRSQTVMKINVFDVLGKQVINETVSNNRLDVSNLSPGLYIMRVSQDNATTTKKLVIQ